MQFLVDASMPRSAATMLRGLGHVVLDVRDIGLGGATDDIIAAHARDTQHALITRDFDFADIRNYPPADHPGLIVLHLPEHAPAMQVVSLLQSVIERQDWLARVPGRLAIVELHRVRFRPA